MKGKEDKKDDVLVSVIMSILEPGVGDGVIKFMNYIFAALFLIILIMIIATRGNIHYYVFLFLAVCLFCSIQYFLYEASKIPNFLQPKKGQNQQKQQNSQPQSPKNTPKPNNNTPKPPNKNNKKSNNSGKNSENNNSKKKK
jgi:hypothetical protein